ncbi:MAG: hypothetical protein KDC90_08580, partial [Ignavibacteriae bacterium]|nr:hypothetical protein [Ignavibacteriota bacterium]
MGNYIIGSNDTECFNACSSGSSVNGNNPPTYSNGGSVDITNIVKNNLGKNIYFGVYEGGDGKAYLYTVTLQIWTHTVPLLSITAKNDMNGYSGGNIGVGINISATSRTSPYSFAAYETNNINLQAYDNQSYNSYNWIFNNTEAPLHPSKWEKRINTSASFISNNQSTSYNLLSGDNGVNLIDYLHKICNQNFTNSFVGLSYKGTMKVNGTSYNCPTQDFGVVEQNTISFQPILYQVQNGIGYLFNHWDDSVTTSIRTVNPIAHKTYTAYYVGKADNAYRGLSINSSDPTGTP